MHITEIQREHDKLMPQYERAMQVRCQNCEDLLACHITVRGRLLCEYCVKEEPDKGSDSFESLNITPLGIFSTINKEKTDLDKIVNIMNDGLNAKIAEMKRMFEQWQKRIRIVAKGENVAGWVAEAVVRAKEGVAEQVGVDGLSDKIQVLQKANRQFEQSQKTQKQQAQLALHNFQKNAFQWLHNLTLMIQALDRLAKNQLPQSLEIKSKIVCREEICCVLPLWKDEVLVGCKNQLQRVGPKGMHEVVSGVSVQAISRCENTIFGADFNKRMLFQLQLNEPGVKSDIKYLQSAKFNQSCWGIHAKSKDEVIYTDHCRHSINIYDLRTQSCRQYIPNQLQPVLKQVAPSGICERMGFVYFANRFGQEYHEIVAYELATQRVQVLNTVEDKPLKRPFSIALGPSCLLATELVSSRVIMVKLVDGWLDTARFLDVYCDGKALKAKGACWMGEHILVHTSNEILLMKSS